jgi:Mrp family chromosome partitioning ATPase/capsular polysaccharide biosynthesis protein
VEGTYEYENALPLEPRPDTMLDVTNNQSHLIGAGRRVAAPQPRPEAADLYLAKIRGRKAMITKAMVVGALAASLAGLLYEKVRTPSYTASAELLLSNTTLQLSGADAVVTQVLADNALVQSAIEMCKSGRVLERVVQRIGPEEIERILPRWGQDGVMDPGRRAVAALDGNVAVKRVGASQVISVRGTALTAKDAARITNEVAEAFVAEQSEMNAVVTTNAGLRDRIKVLGPTSRVISRAFPPPRKDGMRVLAVLVATIAGGAALGLGGAILIALLDRRLRTPEQLAMASTECLGYWPQGVAGRRPREKGTGKSGRLSARLHGEDVPPASPRDVLRCARTATVERCESGLRAVGITSCRTGEDKTAFAMHWASLLARDGCRVLLVDATDDARLSQRLAPDHTRGIQHVLRGTAAFDEVVRSNVSPNLDFLPIGRGAGAGGMDQHWSSLIDAVGARHGAAYEWLVVDLPPLARGTDVRIAGRVLDGLILVVEWARTTEMDLERALQSLGPMRERVLGAVMSRGWQTPAGPEVRVEVKRAEVRRAEVQKDPS